MSDPADTLFDGNHETPFLVAAPLVWFDETRFATMTKLRFRVRAPFYRVAARGSRHIKADGLLVGQPPPRIVGGDLLEYERIYATTPQRPSEPVPFVYPFQFNNAGELVELPIPVTATASYRYQHTANPNNIALARAFKAVKVGESIFYVGTRPATSTRTILAEDESITRVWPGGDYWEIRKLTVSLRSLQTLGS